MPRVRYTLPVYTCVFYGARVAYLKQGARMEYKVLWKTGIKKKEEKGKKRREKKGRCTTRLRKGGINKATRGQRHVVCVWTRRKGRVDRGCVSLAHGYNSVPTGCKPRPPSPERERERAYDFYPALF